MVIELQVLLQQLYEGKELSSQDSEILFTAIVNGELSQISMATTLIALKVRGETIGEITGAALAMRNAAKPFPRPELNQGIVDIVGTGGDKYDTINISTTATFVAAAAGAKVAKHGNRSVSSQAGSSDLLTQFGINLAMSPKNSATCLEQYGLCFLHAPHYHLGVKHAVPVRQALNTRTIFNILGPLINPAKPDYMLLGVYSPDLLVPIAETLADLGVKRAMVVHGSGLDEVAIHDTTYVVELKDKRLQRYKLTPENFGIKPSDISLIQGGTPQDNAGISKAILQGKGTSAQNNAVAVNAGCALYLSGITPCIKTGTDMALDIIQTGKAWSLLNQIATFSEANTVLSGN